MIKFRNPDGMELGTIEPISHGVFLVGMKAFPGRINNYYPKSMRIQTNINFDNLD